MYGNVYDEEERFERQAVFPKLLAKHATDFSWVRERWQLLALIVSMQNKTSFNRDAIKAGTGRRLVVGIPTMYPGHTHPLPLSTGISVTASPPRLIATHWRSLSLATWPPTVVAVKSLLPTLRRPVSLLVFVCTSHTGWFPYFA